MSINLEKAQIMRKLVRKNNWGAKYDRLEHFKRFPNLKKIVKELVKENWIKIKNKPMYTGISLNTEYKKEIMEFIEKEIPEMEGIMK